MMDYILFLRAVNVAGKNKLKMQDLKLALQSEFLDAQTYIQSGNLLIPNCDLNKTEVKSIVEKIVLKNFDIDTTAIIKSSTELQDLMDTIPFQIMETKQLYFCESNGQGPRSSFLSLVRELAADARSSPLPGIFEPAKCRKGWFLAHCASAALPLHSRP